MRCSRRQFSYWARILVIGIIAWSSHVRSHPHVWVVMESEILANDERGVAGFRHRWTFDEYYSSFALSGLDKNNDGVYDRGELQDLAELNIASLRDYGFFTYPRLAGRELERLPPRDYWLEYKNGMLSLLFTLPLKQQVPKADLGTFELAIYDPTFFLSFAFAKRDPIRVAPGLTKCPPRISTPQAQPPAKSLSESIFSSNYALMNLGQKFAETVRIACEGP